MNDSRFHRTMLVLILGMLAISIVGMALSGISVRVEQLLYKGALYCAIFLGSVFYSRRGATQFASALMIVFWLGLFSDLHIFPMFVAGKQAVPFQDQALASFDRWIGLEAPTVMKWIAGYPWLRALLHHAYGTLVFLMTFAVLGTALLHRMQAARELLIACVLAVLICFPIFAVFQAQGPWVYYGYRPSVNQDAYMHVFATLKQSQHYVMDLNYRNGLICFPSFHTILAVLSGVALWSLPVVRWLGLLWSSLIVISTVTTGTHYVVDVLSGILVVVVCVTGAKMWSRWEARRSPSRDFCNAQVQVNQVGPAPAPS